MLDSLKKYDPETASRILAAVALSSINPGVGSAARALDEFVEQREEVVAELRSQATARARGGSIERAFAELLSEQMREVVLAGKDRDKILTRAGAGGRLPTGLFRITFSEEFRRHFRTLGTREAHVIDAIQHADVVDHFYVHGEVADPPYSVFLKLHEAKPRNTFWLLVVAGRRGKTLEVASAFRVYLSDVDLTDAQKPIDVLAAFVEKFGFESTFEGATSKFIQNTPLPPPRSSGPPEILVRGVRGQNYYGTLYLAKNTAGATTAIAIAFTISLTLYAASLRKRGVRAELLDPPEQRTELRVPVYTQAILPRGVTSLRMPLPP